MNGLIGKKVGMTSIYTEAGKNVACTVVELGPCVVTQVKTVETDGYEALQLGFDDAKVKTTTQPLRGHFDKAKVAPKRKLVEFDGLGELEKSLGDIIKVDEVFSEGDVVNVFGKTKGKGFQGVVKRHGFKGVNDQTLILQNLRKL